MTDAEKIEIIEEDSSGDDTEESIDLDELMAEDGEEDGANRGRKIMDRAVLSDHPALRNCTRMSLLGHMGIIFSIGVMIGYSVSKYSYLESYLRPVGLVREYFSIFLVIVVDAEKLYVCHL